MYLTTKKIITFLTLTLLLSGNIFAECSLDTVPSPAVDSFAKNIDTLIEAVKKEAPRAQCSKPSQYPSYLDIAIPAQSIKALLWSMQAVSYNLGSITSDIRYYFNSTGMTLASVQKHQNNILDIKGKILSAWRFVGGYCAQRVQFKEDITIQGSIYKTKDRTLEEVLTDMTGQTSHVLMFFRQLVTNAVDKEYDDEAQFTIAPEWFANEMRKFYTSEALQKCHDEEPKNVAIKEAMKKAFTVGWKYPQAIQIWKQAFQLLLYSAGVGETDASKDAQIKSIISAQKGGLGNSRFVLNSQFFKEFKKRPNQTTEESIKEWLERSATETAGNNSFFWRYTMPWTAQKPRAALDTIFKTLIAHIALASPAYAEDAKAQNTIDFSKTQTSGIWFIDMEKQLYDQYALRRGKVEGSKAQDPKTVTGLVQSLEELWNIRETVEENMKIACANLDKQGTNVSAAARCKDFIKN